MHVQCLIVDDEQALADSTAEYLNLFHVSAQAVYTQESCLTFLEKHTIDILLLDVNLMDASGFLLCKKIREQYNFPIIFISARTRDDDILMGLHVGGDDYVSKPYTLSVLLAKIQAMLKRYGQKEEATTLSVGELTLDEQAGKVFLQKQEISLANMEYKLLQYMMHHVGELLKKERLFEEIWGSSYTQDGTLNVHIRHLREKIETDPQHPQYIKTIWGSGYRLEEPKA